MDVRVKGITRQLLEDAQLLWSKQLRSSHLDHGIFAFEVAVEPAKDWKLQILGILVRTGSDQET